MALGAAMGMTIGMTLFAALHKAQAPGGYGPMPSPSDEDIWASGASAQRRSQQSGSGRPDGMQWRNKNWAAAMPKLIGR